MQYDINSVDEYLEVIPEKRRPAVKKLREVIFLTCLKDLLNKYPTALSGTLFP